MKKPLLYPKLAWQGIRKNAETYLPYLLMGILMVGVSYIMNYLTRPALMGALSMGGTTLMVLQMGKIVISVFSVIFLYYCNSFLIRRRMKEFGLYNILGMGKGNIARVMLWETLLTALLVFAGGLLLGLSLSRLVEMALINLLHADYTVPMELFYPDGVTWVLLLFGGIYVLILLANLLRMRLSNPVALLKSENTGEKPPKANWFFGLLILLSAYYVAAVSQSPLEALIFFFIAVLMVIVATYLLLVSGSVTLCRMLRRNKHYYYQTRHFISVSAMAYRMKRNGAGMATICILCTMVLVILTSTVCLYGGTDSMVDAICPQDINLTIGLEARDGEENWKRLDAMQQMALDVTEEMGLTPENITSQRALVATGKVQNGDYGIITDADSLKANVLELTVYPLSVYEQATGETVTLADRELLYASFKTNETFSSMSFYGSAPYRMIRAEKELPKRLLSADYRSAWGCLVVFTNDAEAFRREITALVGEKSGEAMMMDRLALHFDLDSEADTDTQEKLVKTLRSRSWEAIKSTGKDFYGMSSLNVDTRALCRRDYLSLFGGLFFLGMVLGPLFSIAAVLIMYYKQICEGYEDAERFAVMRKVGLTDAEIRRSVNSQVLTVFFAPLLMAGLHMMFAMPMIRLILGAFGLHNDSLFYGIGIGCYVVFAVIYALMYLLTSRRYYRIVR